MLGAFAEDIIGSIYEFNNIKTKDFPLFSNSCFATDDSIMTAAVSNALINYLRSDKTVDVHIQKLRKKLGLEKEIRTITKLGYRLEV